MVKSKEEVISDYLNVISKIYKEQGRYGYSLMRNELRQKFAREYPEFAEVIERTFNVVKERIDRGRERWPTEYQIKGLAGVITEKFNIPHQPAS
jgi:hypothetical protein